MGDDFDSLLSQPPPDGGEDASWLVSFGDLMSLLLVFFILMVSPQAVVSKDQQNNMNNLDEVVSDLKNEIARLNIGSEVDLKINGNTATLTFKDTLLFPSGQAVFTKNHLATLQKILNPLKQLKGSHHFKIQGHTDSVPIHSSKYPSNWYLSTARALAILDGFINAGFPEKNLAAQGFAHLKPLVPEYTEKGVPIPENRAKNRRVEILIR